jgi:hypothetical protein
LLKLCAIRIHEKGELRGLATSLKEGVVLEIVLECVFQRVRHLHRLLTIRLARLILVEDELAREAFAFQQ